ncbi:MAG: hypothetical protein LBK60_02085 [Verrucomicrobiales bacterium]|jgi:uroporphyrinogen decarboxylase|nr:hypothetical protein [Verrucomicrobiales bacterium]
MPAALSRKERLRRQALGLEVDRVPSIGGWMLSARNLAAIAGTTVEEYLQNPEQGMVRANLALDTDGIVTMPVYPKELEQLRAGSVQESDFQDIEPEVLLEVAEQLPDDEDEALKDFDRVRERQRFLDIFAHARADWGGLEPLPNFWDLGGPFALYQKYGYIAFLSACALYPEAVGKIWRVRALVARERAKLLAPLYAELDLVPLLFCGEDLCNNSGPMVSPELLRRYYFPVVKDILAPLVAAGVRVVHHCDGDIRPVVDDFIATGFSGLQGFQYELGLEIPELRGKKAAGGRDLLFFAGLSVTRTLPFGTPDEVRREVDYFFDATDNGRGLFLFTSNVTGVEVPWENLVAGYRRAKELTPGQPRAGAAPLPQWPRTRDYREC